MSYTSRSQSGQTFNYIIKQENKKLEAIPLYSYSNHSGQNCNDIDLLRAINNQSNSNQLNQKIVDEHIKAIFNMKEDLFDDLGPKVEVNEKADSIQKSKRNEEELNKIRQTEFEVKRIIDLKMKECILNRSNQTEYQSFINPSNQSSKEKPTEMQISNFNLNIQFPIANPFKSNFSQTKHFANIDYEINKIISSLDAASPDLLIRTFYKSLDCFVKFQKAKFFEENFRHQILFDKLSACLCEQSSNIKLNKKREFFSSELPNINNLFKKLMFKLECYLIVSANLNIIFSKQIDLITVKFKVSLFTYSL